MKKSFSAVMLEVGQELETLSMEAEPRVEFLGFPTSTQEYSDTYEMALSVPVSTLESLVRVSEILKQEAKILPSISIEGSVCGVEAQLLEDNLQYSSAEAPLLNLIRPEGTSGLFEKDAYSKENFTLPEDFLEEIGRDAEDCDVFAREPYSLEIVVNRYGIVFTGIEKFSDYRNTITFVSHQLPDLVARAREAAGMDAEESSSPAM